MATNTLIITNELIRPRIASRTVTYSTPIERLRNMPRFSEKAIGTREATRTTITSLRHGPRPAAAIAAKATGVSAPMLPPQSLVKANGAAGRGTGKPRNACTCANTGWTSSWTNGLLRRPCGSTCSMGGTNVWLPSRMPA